MGTYKEIQGDLIALALSAEFDVIVHGCNCQNTMGAGIAPQMVKAFGCDKFPLEEASFKGDINKLGQIDYKVFYQEKIEFGGKWVVYPDELSFMTGKSLAVVNAYTQFMYGQNHIDGVSKPLDYEALTLCLRKINHIFKGEKIGLPQIGCGLAGGVWNMHTLPMFEQITRKDLPARDVQSIIQQELKDCDVTVVIYNK